MKKKIFCFVLCALLLFCASCTITVPYESVEESLTQSEQETASEGVEQEEVPDPTEIEYTYTPLDEGVKANIEAYLGTTFSCSISFSKSSKVNWDFTTVVLNS